MHSIISDECTGCELCVAPCPVDCIDLEILHQAQDHEEKKSRARDRFQARQDRLLNEQKIKIEKRQPAALANKKDYVRAAIARAKAKQQSRTL